MLIILEFSRSYKQFFKHFLFQKKHLNYSYGKSSHEVFKKQEDTVAK